MNLHSRKVIIFLASLVFLLIPVIVAYAADYVLLEPSLVDKNPGATSPGLTTYLGWLYNSFFALIAIASFVLIVWGGFEYVTSSIPGLKANGLARINQALLGFGIALFAWLILETISAGTFTNINLNLDNVGGTSYSAGPAGTGGGTRVPSGPTTPATDNPTPSTTGTGRSNITEDEARKKLESLGIPVNAQPPQTTLVGMQPTTVDALVGIKEDSLCDLMVTGGTEDTTGGHSPGMYSHVNGYKVDIDNNDCIDKYFTGWTKIAPRRDRVGGQTVLVPQYQNGNIIAADERHVPTRGSHWDIQVKPGTPGGTH